MFIIVFDMVILAACEQQPSLPAVIDVASMIVAVEQVRAKQLVRLMKVSWVVE